MSPRHSILRNQEIEYGFWLIFAADGGLRLSRGEPQVGRAERAMACTATLPRSLFSAPQLKATIGIAEGVPSTFQVDVQAAQDALKSALGVDVDLRIGTPEQGS